MESVDYYELLGVQQSASIDEIKKAIRSIRREYRIMEGSPDPDQRRRAENAMSILSECERVLTDPNERAQYDAQYQNAAVRQVMEVQRQQKAKSEETCQQFYNSAQEYINKKNYARALVLIDEAEKYNVNHDILVPMSGAMCCEGMREFKLGLKYLGTALQYAMEEQSKEYEALIEDLFGITFFNLEDYANAEEAFDSAARACPDQPNYACRVVFIKTLQHKDAEALQIAQALSQKYPDDAYVRNVYINAIFWYVARVIASNNATDAMIANGDQGFDYWFTNTRQIEEARKYEQLLAQLGPVVPSDEVFCPPTSRNENIADMRRQLDYASKRSWDLPETKYLVALGIGWVVFAFIMFHFDPLIQGILLLILVTAAIVAFGLWRCYCYGWQYNRRICGGPINKTGLQVTA